MPITFIPHPNGPAIGVGVPMGWSSDFIGPLPRGTFWRLRLIGPGGENNIWLEATLGTASGFGGRYTPFIQSMNTGWNTTINIQQTIAHQAEAHVQVELVTPTGVVDSGTTGTTWDAQSGLGFQISQQVGASAGAFTQQDRQMLADALANTTVDMTDTTRPSDIRAVPVGRLFTQHPLVWNERVGPFVITGRGAISLDPGVNRGWYTGMRWFFTVIPPGWGMTPGAIDEFDNRPAQLVPVYVMESGEEIGSPILDVTTSGGWQDLNSGWGLSRIEYIVAPGWTVTVFMYRVIGSG